MHHEPKSRRTRARIGLAVALAILASLSLLAGCTHPSFGPLHTPAADGSDRIPPRVGFAIVKTGTLVVREGLLYSGGDLSKTVQNHYSAFLIKHDDTLFLFDTGLGRNVRAQYAADMPFWRRPFFRYDDPVVPARDQLEAVGPIDRIVLSHAHWDHASGLVDFPGVPIYVAKEELDFIHSATGSVGGAWPSQVSSPTLDWKTVTFADTPYEGFDRSADLFGDRSVVLVPMSGHTPGSIGMFVETDSHRRYFFVGDVVWSAGALREGRPKSFLARRAADRDVDATQRTIELIRAAMKRDPQLVVIPAHDGTVQRALGYYPGWVR
jgi:glyoxylase-like metal-dependent hydrolase (beta-lactamase superfamily II)